MARQVTFGERTAVRDRSPSRAYARIIAAMRSTQPALPAQAPRGCTCAKLRRLSRRVTAVYDRELAAAGLRVTQYSMLGLIQREAGQAGMPLTALAERLDMDRTTLTRNLKPLIAQGWAELVTSETDARVRLARVTAAGAGAWAAARPHWKRAQQEVNRTLGDDTVERLHQWLDAVTPLFRPPPPGSG
jgi:DNA-binding MarR family transcriptional regulator